MTASALRTALRAAFPAATFSVNVGRGSAYGNLYVRWTDGPSRFAVRTALADAGHNHNMILLMHEVNEVSE